MKLIELEGDTLKSDKYKHTVINKIKEKNKRIHYNGKAVSILTLSFHLIFLLLLALNTEE